MQNRRRLELAVGLEKRLDWMLCRAGLDAIYGFFLAVPYLGVRLSDVQQPPGN